MLKKICDLPEGQEVVGMATFEDNVIIATTLGVWRLENDELVPIVFQMPDDLLVVDKGEITVACICGWVGLETSLVSIQKLVKSCPSCKKAFISFPRGK